MPCDERVVRSRSDMESLRDRQPGRSQPCQGLPFAADLSDSEALLVEWAGVSRSHRCADSWKLPALPDADPVSARRRPQHRIANLCGSGAVGEGGQAVGYLAAARLRIHRGVGVRDVVLERLGIALGMAGWQAGQP